MDETEEELKRERENADRLAAALELLVGCINPTNGDSHLHIVIGNHKATNQLTVGHVVTGALVQHDRMTITRTEL